MTKDTHTIRNDVIAAVVGGLILSFILWLLSFLPVVTATVSVPIWLLITLGASPFVVAILYRRKAPAIASSSVTRGPAKQPITEDDPPQFGEVEKGVLQVLVEADGRDVEMDQFHRRIGVPRLRIEQAIDSLEGRDFVVAHFNAFSPASYSLTPKGRHFLIQAGLV